MIEQVIEPHQRDLGGFSVGRVLPQVARRSVGPFVFFDHFGPARFEPGFPRSADVRPHPHIGLATVSYLFEGELTHRDSVGSDIAVRPGEVNWMTAGRGITHSERFDALRRTGGVMHGIQAWVALPEADEEMDPAFAHHGPEDLPTYEGGGLWARLVAGRAFGAEAKVETQSPLFYVHWRLAAGAKAQLGAEFPERAAFVARGEVELDGRVFVAGQMLILEAGKAAVFTAVTDCELMLLGGEPVGPRFLEWNFVSSSRERIEEAKADWRAGRMKLPDADHDEFIPLPADPPATAPPPS
jgi:redox-sensitive bicupin YhaK (pirin superfamily)